MALITKANLIDYMHLSSADQTTYSTFLDTIVLNASAVVNTYCRRTFESTSYTGEMYDGSGTTKLYLKQAPITAVSRVSIGARDAISLQATASDADSQTVALVGTTLTLTILGGASAGSHTVTVGSGTSLSSLVSTVNGYSGWTATLLLTNGTSGTDLLFQQAHNLIYQNTVSLEAADVDVDDYEIRATEGYLQAWYWPRGENLIRVSYTAGYSTIPYDVQEAALETAKLMFDRSFVDGNVLSESTGNYSYTLARTADDPQSMLLRRLAKWVRYV